jgi:hypothetical protein
MWVSIPNTKFSGTLPAASTNTTEIITHVNIITIIPAFSACSFNLVVYIVSENMLAPIYE